MSRKKECIIYINAWEQFVKGESLYDVRIGDLEKLAKWQFVNTNYDIRNTNFKVRRLRRNVAKPCISYWCNYGSKR